MPQKERAPYLASFPPPHVSLVLGILIIWLAPVALASLDPLHEEEVRNIWASALPGTDVCDLVSRLFSFHAFLSYFFLPGSFLSNWTLGILLFPFADLLTQKAAGQAPTLTRLSFRFTLAGPLPPPPSCLGKLFFPFLWPQIVVH